MRVPEGPILPHQDFGDPECCGTLWPVIRGEEADIVCNECDAVVKTVPAAELQRTIAEMEFSLDACVEKCPYCGEENVFTGFTEMLAYTCRHCGRAVNTQSLP